MHLVYINNTYVLKMKGTVILLIILVCTLSLLLPVLCVSIDM